MHTVSDSSPSKPRTEPAEAKLAPTASATMTTTLSELTYEDDAETQPNGDSFGTEPVVE